MFHDAEHLSGRAVAAEAALAPIAMSAGEVDLTDDSLPNPRLVCGLCDFADKFVARRAEEPVVSALEFQVGGTDSRGEQADSRKTFRHSRQRNLAEPHASRFQMNGKHRLK